MGLFGDEHDGDEKRFGIHGIKLLIATIFSLIGVVILAILLFFYAKHLQRRQQRRRANTLYRLALTTQIAPIEASYYSNDQQPKPGLDPLVIASLPEFIYKPKEQQPQLECSVCLSTIREETKVRVLPNCKHMFHVECIDMWLGSNTTCPLCRSGVEPMVLSSTDHHEQQQNGLGFVQAQPTAPPYIDESAIYGRERS